MLYFALPFKAIVIIHSVLLGILFLAYKDNTYQMIDYASLCLSQVTVSLPSDRDDCRGHIYFPLSSTQRQQREGAKLVSLSP